MCRPRWVGGLGVLDMKWMNVALQAKWLWLQRVDRNMPWTEFTFSVLKESRHLFQAATRADVGDGKDMMFWEDRWLNGYRIQELAPRAYDRILAKTRRSRTVYVAIAKCRWAWDMGPALDAEALWQYMATWPMVAAIQLDYWCRDRIVGPWDKDGQYSAKSAYAAKFTGLEVSPTATFTWHSWTLLRCRFFAWLAIMNRCWTSKRLARRGLPHQDSCPLCDQHSETIGHLLIDCVFAQEVWAKVFTAQGMPHGAPQAGEALADWRARHAPYASLPCGRYESIGMP